MPPDHKVGFDGWDQLPLTGDPSYWYVRLSGRRPYDFPPVPTEKPKWLVRNVIRSEILVFEFYDKKSVPKPSQADPILEAPGRVGQPLGYVPPITHLAKQQMKAEGRERVRVDDVAATWTPQQRAVAANHGCVHDWDSPTDEPERLPIKYRPANIDYDVTGTAATERNTYIEYEEWVEVIGPDDR